MEKRKRPKTAREEDSPETRRLRSQSRVISRPTVPFDLPKSRLPSVFHPTARQSCSLGSKRFGTDLSKLYGTAPISYLFPSSLPSIHLPSPSPVSLFFLPSICSPPRYPTLVTINPTKTFSLLGPRR